MQSLLCLILPAGDVKIIYVLHRLWSVLHTYTTLLSPLTLCFVINWPKLAEYNKPNLAFNPGKEVTWWYDNRWSRPRETMAVLSTLGKAILGSNSVALVVAKKSYLLFLFSSFDKIPKLPNGDSTHQKWHKEGFATPKLFWPYLTTPFTYYSLSVLLSRARKEH